MKVSRKEVVELSRKANKKLRQISRRPGIRLQAMLNSEPPTERYIFHHIPKCAGTSAVDALTHWFIVVKDYAPGWSESSDLAKYRRYCENPKELSSLKPHAILVGHFHVDGSYLHQRYPHWMEEGFRLITFVRDPLRLQISLYKYEIKMGRISADENLEKRLMLRPNYMAERFPCNDENYIEALDRYFFLGTMDDYQAAFDRLAKSIARPRVDLKQYNATDRLEVKLSKAFVSEFKEKNSLDYKIYEYVQDVERRSSERSGAVHPTAY